MKYGSIKKTTWSEIRNRVSKVNFRLAEVIDAINPDESYSLYLARYPFGSKVVDEGIFHLPSSSGEVVPIDDNKINDCVRNDLNYLGTGVPSGIILEHTIHEVVTICGQMLPLGVVKPGSIFALWKKLDSDPSFHPVNMFTLTAGARFIFMGPNISNLTQHRNLMRDFNLRLHPSKDLLGQWEIFKILANHPSNKEVWFAELLFFSSKWFEKIMNDQSWQPLKLLLLEEVWKKSGYERNNMLYNLAFSRAQANRNLKPNPYLADTIKHLFAISSGVLPGFSPAINDACAPISLFQKIYVESYGLKYNPTIFIPSHFSLSNNVKPVYYFMSLPTTLEFSPKSRKVSNTIHSLSEVKHVMNVYLDEIKKKNLSWKIL